MVENIVEAVDPRRGQGTDRTGGNGVYPCTLRAESLGQVAHGCLKSRFGDTHDVVAREYLHRSVIAERQRSPPPTLHHRLGRFHDRQEGVNTDIHGGGKAFTGGVYDRPLQLILVRKSDRMDDYVAAGPDVDTLGEDGGNLIVAGDITGEYCGGINRFCQRADPLLDGLPGVGYRHFGTLLMKKPGDRPGNTLIVGNTENYGFFPK